MKTQTARTTSMKNNTPDSELVRQIVSGINVDSSFATLYNRYYSYIHGALWNASHNSEIMEDLMQDAWAKIFRKIKQYNPEMGAFKSWAADTASNVAIDHWRKSKRATQGSHQVELRDYHAQYSVHDSMDTKELEVITKKALRQSLDESRIPIINQEAVRMFINGTPEHEVMQYTGVGGPTLRGQAKRIRDNVVYVVRNQYRICHAGL